VPIKAIFDIIHFDFPEDKKGKVYNLVLPKQDYGRQYVLLKILTDHLRWRIKKVLEVF